MKKIKILKKIILAVLVVCLAVPSMQGSYYADFDKDDPEYYMVGEGNQSTTYYKWMRIRSMDELEALVNRYGKDTPYRCMLLCADIGADPKEIGIYDKENYWDDRIIKPDLEDLDPIEYNEDIFFTRGGMMTPYLEYLGRSVHDLAGDGAKVKLYLPNHKDQKTSTLICNSVETEWLGVSTTVPSLYYMDENKFTDKRDGFTSYNYWFLSFPGQNQMETFRLSDIEEEYVGFCIPQTHRYDWGEMDGKEESAWMTWDYDGGADYYLEYTPAKNESHQDIEKLLFECYIGIPIEENKVDAHDTLKVPKDATVVWEDCSVNNGTIFVENGGTLIVSGTCINNGKIYVHSGGKLIIQKGALVRAIEPEIKDSAGIRTIGGGTVIIREGARVIAKNVDNDMWAVYIDRNSTLVNYGYILGEISGMYRHKEGRYVKSSSAIYDLVEFDFKPGHSFLAGYDRNDPYVTLDRYLAAVHSECYQILMNNYNSESDGSGASGSW